MTGIEGLHHVTAIRGRAASEHRFLRRCSGIEACQANGEF